MAFGDNMKTAILKGIEALGKGASTLAEGAQQKLSEMNLEVRRHELADKIPGLVMELYRSGEPLPEALTTMLDELSGIDAQLAEMRAQHAPKQEEPTEEEQEFTEEAVAEAEETEEEAAPAEEEVKEETED